MSGARALSFLPGPGTPGLPLAVTLLVWTRVNPRGRFPGGRDGPSDLSGSRGGPERLLRVVFPPGGTARHPSRESEQPCQGERNRMPQAQRAQTALPTPDCAAAQPGAE